MSQKNSFLEKQNSIQSYLINVYVLFSSLSIRFSMLLCVRVLNIPGKATLSQITQNLDHMC